MKEEDDDNDDAPVSSLSESDTIFFGKINSAEALLAAGGGQLGSAEVSSDALLTSVGVAAQTLEASVPLSSVVQPNVVGSEEDADADADVEVVVFDGCGLDVLVASVFDAASLAKFV